MEGKGENHDPGTVSLPPATAVVGREENLGGSAVAVPAPAPESGAGTVGTITPVSESFTKKRGRPRKYGPDGKPAVTLSPMPISASIPLTGDFPGWKVSQGKPISSIKRKHLEFVTPVVGEGVAYTVSANFTPHVITVNTGEDVNMKIISFAQQREKAICVLAANGAISNVTLRQPNSCGGTLTHEGRFDILSLSGSFVPSDIGGAKGRSGGMSVSLAGPDGRVLGGGLAGMLVAAGPVQVVLGSFIPGHQQEQQKPKKSRFEHVTPYGFESNISFTPTNPIHKSRALNHETNGSLHASEPKELQARFLTDSIIPTFEQC